MAFLFQELQDEVAARGFSYLTTAGGGSAADLVRLKRAINDASHELDQEERWDYRFASSTGAAPLTIADLDQVESVTDVVNLNPLMQIDRQALTNDVADLTTTGLAAYWYKTAPTTIAAFPVSTVTLTVKYLKFGPDLSAVGDAPLAPDRFRPIIVEAACAKLFADASDWDARRACLEERSRLLQLMRMSMLTAPERQARTTYALDD